MIIRNTAVILKQGIIAGIISKGEIIKWADSVIQGTTQYNDYIAELSLAGTKSNDLVLKLLNELIQEEKQDDINIIKIFYLYHFSHRYNQTPNEWFDIKRSICNLFGNLKIEVNDFLYCLLEDYNLRKDGFAGNMNQPYELASFFIRL